MSESWVVRRWRRRYAEKQARRAAEERARRVCAETLAKVSTSERAERMAEAALRQRVTLHDWHQEPPPDFEPGDVVIVSTPQGAWRCVVREDGSWRPVTPQ